MSRAESRVDSAKNRVAKTQARTEQLSTTAAGLESQVADAELAVEDRGSEVVKAQDALDDAKSALAVDPELTQAVRDAETVLSNAEAVLAQ